MDDNIYMERCCHNSFFVEHTIEASSVVNGSGNGFSGSEQLSWRPNYILDFSDVSIG